MNLSLDPEVWKFIEERVRAGQYATAEDVVREAIARLRSDEELAAEELDDETLAALAESDAQYERGEVRDWKDVSAELRAKYLGQ
jgi:putative addiction module CopG family antidote